MNTLIQQFLNSLTIGSEYALIALGYTMVYGVLRLINFAHGEVFMVGAYTGAYIAQTTNGMMGHPPGADQSLPQFILVVVVSMTAAGMLGYLIERLAYRPLRKSTRLAALITAIGVSLLLQALAQIGFQAGGRTFFGPTEETFPPVAGINMPLAWLRDAAHLYVKPRDLIEWGACAGMLGALWFIVKKTRTGRGMRAVSFSYDGARLMGVDLNKIISFTFMLGSALAAFAACLVGMRTNKCTYDMGLILGLKAFIAAVIGGIGNIPGAAVGAFLLGFVETLVSSIQIGGVGLSLYRNAIAFIILILVLLVRPEGILGKPAAEKV